MTRLSERIARAVKSARAQVPGMTQEDLAQAAGVSVRTVSRLEQGLTTHPREDEFARIADALGTSVTLLMGFEDEPISDDSDEESETDIDAELDELTRDADLVLAFMSRVRDPKQLSRAAKLVIRDDLRRIRARQQRKG